MAELATCPKCDGTTRRPVPESSQKWKNVIAGYDPVTDTFACDNCGGQTMSLRATGKVPLNRDGKPCLHNYERKLLRNCYHGYTCIHCGDHYTIDSGD